MVNMIRKSFRRTYKNALAIGIASFSSIALLSTGLAAFVIIGSPTETVNGGIKVEEVIDNDITLTIDPVAERQIVLDAAPEDNEGRVQLEPDSTGAVLTTTVSGTIGVGGNKTLEDINFTYKVLVYQETDPEDDPSTIDDETFKEDYMKDRVVFVPVELALGASNTIDIDEIDEANGTFTFDFGFAWGSKYDGTNPSLYYDEHDDGQAVSNAEVVIDLEELKSLLDGVTFTIEVSAKLI
jgi:hypothetical protein